MVSSELGLQMFNLGTDLLLELSRDGRIAGFLGHPKGLELCWAALLVLVIRVVFQLPGVPRTPERYPLHRHPGDPQAK